VSPIREQNVAPGVAPTAGSERRSHQCSAMGRAYAPTVAVHGNRVVCDHEGCDYSVAFQVLRPGATDRFTSEPLPRHMAKKEGWRIADDGDFCPRHNEIWEIRET
jgi:hypothetical protein